MTITYLLIKVSKWKRSKPDHKNLKVLSNNNRGGFSESRYAMIGSRNRRGSSSRTKTSFLPSPRCLEFLEGRRFLTEVPNYSDRTAHSAEPWVIARHSTTSKFFQKVVEWKKSFSSAWSGVAADQTPLSQIQCSQLKRISRAVWKC